MKVKEKLTNKEKQALIIRKYQQYLKLEKSLAPNTFDAYMTDLQKLLHFLEGENIEVGNVTPDDLQRFAAGLHDIGIHPRSQARILSGIKSFFHFLTVADYLETDPSELLEGPKIGFKIPEVLTVEEIDRIISAVDMDKKEGQRNRAILETLYSCGLAPNTFDAYMTDLQKLLHFLEGENIEVGNVTPDDLQRFAAGLHDIGIHPRSQARILSGIKSFFHFLTVADYLETDPSELLEGPKIGFKIPEVLTVEEIDRIISAVDMDKKEGQRNRAILETLYSCGLRVSELCNLKLSDLYFEEGFIKVEGKGSKQRLVPISPRAIKEIKYWLTDRNLGKIKKGYEDYVFLARWGNNISRIMVFHMIKELAEKTGITKNISPHTFRHSFATHLLEGGANLRAIQCMLGHESIATTEIYTHIDRNMLRSEIIEHHPRNIKYRKERGIY